MGAEKHGSKNGGGYVGGLLQLFDWNAKSRKKLFSSKSSLPEQSKQKKRCDGNLPMTRLHLMDEDEILIGTSIKGSSDYSCASSVIDEDVSGIRPPGVVARLMGLDSLPTSNSSEPYSTPYFDTQSLKDSHYSSRNLEVHCDYRLMHSGNLCDKMEAPARHALEPQQQKPPNRPIEKFQTEILPPKSAKSIPITHHKLLSPIKSANFIPSENAAHIMEAAARIIGPGPQAASKAKIPVVGSSSVPLKVKDLKEKVEAAKKSSKLAGVSRQPGESNALKHLKGQSMNKSWNGSAETTSLKASSDSEGCSAITKRKGKSISLALQAKANVQKREGLKPSGSRSLIDQKELNEVLSSELFKSQPSAQKSTHKKPSTLSSSSVLRPNNQKQNCLADRGNLEFKPSCTNSQYKKPVSGDSSVPRFKSSSKSSGNSKVVSRRSNSEVLDGKREDSYSSTRNISCKKRSIDGNFHCEKTLNADNMWINKSNKAIQSSVSTDKESNFSEASRRKGTDVVSFTFTAPMTRSVNGPETFREVGQKNNGFCADFRGKGSLFSLDDLNSSKFPLSRHNVIGGDALSALLEQKLRELTHGVDNSLSKAEKGGAPASGFEDWMPGLDALSTSSSSHDYRTQMHTDEIGSDFSSGFSSTDLQGFIMKHKFQGTDQEMNRCSRNEIEAKRLLDYRFPSPVSVLQNSCFLESCNSSDTAESITTGGSKQSSSVQAQEVLGTSSSKKLHPSEADAELSDSASSISASTVAAKQVITLSSADPGESTQWELEYLKEILCNIDLMFKDFALGRARDIINPHLFDQLESRKEVFKGNEPKLGRKLLFDCVTECLDIRCRRYVGGGCRTWAKGLSVVRSKDRLTAEVNKEISEWSGLGDCMVDELVDKDMSNKYGRWLDFEIEAFELGVQIESRILNFLLDEVIADIL